MDPKLDTQDLMDELTMAGLEVDSSGPVARQFSGIVVGEVESVESHPDADKLSVCQVNDGGKSFQVVCGATNVRKGIKVPFANIGAESPIRTEVDTHLEWINRVDLHTVTIFKFQKLGKIWLRDCVEVHPAPQ